MQVGSYLHRIKSGRIFTGKKVLVPGGMVTKALPDNLIVSVSEYPENFGRLCFEDGSYGISILAPHALSVFEILPPMNMSTRGSFLAMSRRPNDYT